MLCWSCHPMAEADSTTSPSITLAAAPTVTGPPANAEAFCAPDTHARLHHVRVWMVVSNRV